MMDEDVFLDETILAEDEAALLLLDRDEALASRLSRWKRPALPADLVSGCSRSVGTAPFPPPARLPSRAWLVQVCVEGVTWGGSSILLLGNCQLARGLVFFCPQCRFNRIHLVDAWTREPWDFAHTAWRFSAV